MIGDVSVSPGVFTKLEKALKGLLVCQHTRIHAADLPGGSERPRIRASAPASLQMRSSVVGHRIKHLDLPCRETRADIADKWLFAEELDLPNCTVHITNVGTDV